MSKLTVTIDTDLYKVVPVEALACMTAYNVTGVHPASAGMSYRAMVKAVPDTLPGVMVHSGNPSAWWAKATGAFYLSEESMRRDVKERDHGVVKLFTHPPVQPDTELTARNIELAQRLEWARQDLIKQAEKIDKLEAQIAAQAGQENDWYPASQEPEEYGNYIIVQPGGTVSYQGYFGHPYGQPEAGWYSSGGSSSGPIIRPLYWRKFPLPTNKNNDDKKYTYAGCESCACPKGICQSDFSAAPPTPANAIAIVQLLLDWVDSRIDAEVSHRPDENVYKRTLLETWTQMRRRLLELKNDGSAAPQSVINSMEGK